MKKKAIIKDKILCICAGLCLVTQSCPTLCDPVDYSPPGSSVHGDSPGQNTGVGCYALLQGIFPTQGSNPGLPHCRRILYQLSYQGSPSSPHGFFKSDFLAEWPWDQGNCVSGKKTDLCSVRGSCRMPQGGPKKHRDTEPVN